MKEEYFKKCFFCNEDINEKKTFEHIISDSLLGKLNIKEQTITSEFKIQYSRIKVPAHSKCNNNFGSEFENKIIKLLEKPDDLYSLINNDNQFDLVNSHSDKPTLLLTTWLTKVYYGLFYNDFLKTKNDKWRDICFEIINNENFKLTQKAYQLNSGFNLPSSLYAFKTEKKDFNLKTLIYPASILISINGLILILSIADGLLCKNYLNSSNINNLKNYLKTNDFLEDFPTDLFAFAEITALRLNIPKNPNFIFTDKKIVNLSFNTFVKNPNEFYKVNSENIERDRNHILEKFGVNLA